jgi:hypothetical protein
MIENNFFPATKPMGYLLNAFRKRLTTIPLQARLSEDQAQGLLPEQVPEVQSLRIHQKVVNRRKIGNTHNQRHYHIDNCLTHRISSLKPYGRSRNPGAQWPCSAGALNSGEPIEEPQTYRAGDVENHPTDSDLKIAIDSCRCHRVSFS